MMLFKLSLRNIRKSIKDYVIYFTTLILGVGIFYVFNSIEDQSVLMYIAADTREMVQSMLEIMPIVSVFVAFVLGFLIVYANTFLMKRRKKEFGIYLILGMSKGKISLILIFETVIIGLISLVAGLFLGILASQGMSILIVDLFEADMTRFQFQLSEAAVIKTLVYFLVMYAFVIVLDLFMVGKSKLITLIQSGKKSQKNFAKNPILCIIIFIVAVCLLGTAYYKVTARVRTISQFSQLGIQVAKGIIGTFLLFWSLSGLILLLVKKNKKFYYRGLNSFSTKELSSRVNTTVFSSGVICLLLFFCICIFSSAVSIKRTMDENLKYLVPMDVQFDMWSGCIDDFDMMKMLESRNLPTDELKDIVEFSIYDGDAITGAPFDSDSSWYADMYIPCMKLSDYNQMAEAFGLEKLSLSDTQYAIVSDYTEGIVFFNPGLEKGIEYTLGGKTYYPAYSECIKGYYEITGSASNFGFAVFPDDADFFGLDPYRSFVCANYKVSGKEEKRKLDEKLNALDFDFVIRGVEDENSRYSWSEEAEGEVVYHTNAGCTTRNEIYDNSVGMSAMVVFLGSYLGIVFLISSGAILALKELSEATDNKEKYQILRRIGVDERQIRRSLLAQCGVFFGLPLAVGVIHSIFGMQTATFILAAFGRTGMLKTMVISGAIILGIYGIYFWITYICCRKIISE